MVLSMYLYTGLKRRSMRNAARYTKHTTTLECFEGHKHPHPQHPQKLHSLAQGGCRLSILRISGRAQGLMWGAGGPFLPVAAMGSYGCVGRCWPLEANVRLPFSHQLISLAPFFV